MAYTITNGQREEALQKLTKLEGNRISTTPMPEREKYWIDQLTGYLQPPTRNYYKFEDEELTLLSMVGIEESHMGIH